MVRLSGTIRVLVASGLVGGALIALGWLDYRATRTELVSLLRDQALTLRQTIAAAARSNEAAGAQAESQSAARLLDNARFFAELHRRRALDQKTLAELADRNRLFRVFVIGPDGARELSSGRVGSGSGRGPGDTPQPHRVMSFGLFYLRGSAVLRGLEAASPHSTRMSRFDGMVERVLPSQARPHLIAAEAG